MPDRFTEALGRRVVELRELAFKQSPFSLVGDQLECSLNGFACLVGSPELAQQLTSRRVVVPEVFQPEGMDERQSGFRPLDLRDRDCAIQLDDR